MNDTPIPRLLSLRDVTELVPYSANHLRKLAKAGEFPAPIEIGPMTLAFVEDEVREWIATHIRDRRSPNFGAARSEKARQAALARHAKKAARNV
jgi:prophage regulatory protein